MHNEIEVQSIDLDVLVLLFACCNEGGRIRSQYIQCVL